VRAEMMLFRGREVAGEKALGLRVCQRPGAFSISTPLDFRAQSRKIRQAI
jgi:hypothetical protein